MQRRQLEFRDLGEVSAEVDRLHQGGYQPVGRWNLSQIGDHLSYFIEGTLDGSTFRVPWLMRVLFGRLVLWRILKTGRMREGVPTPQKPLPEPGADEAAAVARLKQALQRLANHPGEMYASPFFGYLTPQQWRDLHRIHCAHHLSFLLPKPATP